ncbi:hypothetical protein PHYBLDRAFT_174602 [Phycomyces blakesleeanus NRRL 1555(-)]|uniref:Uncharacterized protein n=1 Tax=Phycomyces blakesleeanus (strain ATCC 8743b / DSM 1359 / FGSC 10004 / NBRC 33097 / NRRL 1555) TaxID=763407 RepID=A0A167K3U4_PHYB8|nr:hypothetical protein PHYBLDRAFT_174602 [Phycomyces blakesleeanus NRRL 1555(-)]OAD67218.1 hypothetical protein PHYBLDRAFT_174602 [Phycomyces blakesleeanus NRRL 1555(-)]|eukprot:XP_018285258.1 hypothetical protein PHYBLDRAFT_174602 [Phycomyces blakesleeanus NRRL 1555(-)]
MIQNLYKIWQTGFDNHINCAKVCFFFCSNSAQERDQAKDNANTNNIGNRLYPKISDYNTFNLKRILLNMATTNQQVYFKKKLRLVLLTKKHLNIIPMSSEQANNTPLKKFSG